MKAIKTTNQKCRQHIERMEAFEASNLRGYWLRDQFYVVESYRWYPLFVYDARAGKWLANGSKYSVSTSKQYGQAKPGCTAETLSHDEIKARLLEG